VHGLYQDPVHRAGHGIGRLLVGNSWLKGLLKKLPAVIMWAVAFAFVEAAVVEYLRALYYPLHKGGFLFPLMTASQIQAMGDEHWRRLLIEVGRELCTLIMLAGVGAMAGRNRREAWAHFMIAFGVWDIFFYLWLKVFLNWPAGVMTWDLLFLVPVPWVSPVLAPVLISLTMIGAGVVILWFERRGCPLIVSWADWALMTGGGFTVIVAFCWDYRNIMQGGMPNPFLWPLFLLGLGVGLGTFVAAWRRRPRESNNVKHMPA
jgi:hypothetical protein